MTKQNRYGFVEIRRWSV